MVHLLANMERHRRKDNTERHLLDSTELPRRKANTVHHKAAAASEAHLHRHL
jgi:hypothetical protein